MVDKKEGQEAPPPVGLYSNFDIGVLLDKAELTVNEEDLRKIIQRYELKSGLIAIGKASAAIFSSKKDANRIGRTAYRDPVSGAFVTQFALAYLANILIASRSNDYKYKKQIADKQNLLALCNIYSNGLIAPHKERDTGIPPTSDDILTLMVRMHTEQFETQYNPALLISRTIVIFTQVIDEIRPTKFDELSVVFERETGLNITEYFFLVMAVFACVQKKATFRKENLTDAAIPSLKQVLTDKKVSAFINMLSTDYWSFRNLDEKMNANLSPEDTKNRFNPLQVYPIIKTDIERGEPYVVPNIMLALKKGFWGLYWWFHLHFESKNEHRAFRDYFGPVFEAYVGRILKGIYGESNVHPEIVYPGGKFIDWWVKGRFWKTYLFEVKAYQFPLLTKQTGEIELLKKEVKTKVVGAIRQLYDRISEINQYDELKVFRRRRLVPIIVFLEIPLVSSNLYKDLIEKELDILEREGRRGIKNMKVYLMNIDELEIYQGASKQISIDKVFKKYEKNSAEGFHSIVQKITKTALRNAYLDSVYKDFWRKMSGTDIDAIERDETEVNEDLSFIRGTRPNE